MLYAKTAYKGRKSNYLTKINPNYKKIYINYNGEYLAFKSNYLVT